MAAAKAAGPIPIGFLVSTLATGGAERELEHIVTHLDRARFAPRLYTLRAPGPIGDALIARGVPAATALQRGRWPSLTLPVTLARRLGADGVRCLYCLDHTNAIVSGVLAARVAGGLPLLMAVHTTGQWDRPSIPGPVRAVLTGVTRVIAVAEAQRRYLVERERIAPAKVTVIRNGIPPIDPDSLPSVAEAREALGISAGEGPVAGIIAMLRPEKGHETFLAAARLVLAEHPRAIFVVVGDGPRAEELAGLARNLGIAPRVIFLGRRDDIPRVLRALDLSVLASHPRVETLPLSQMEAMSCGLPVVATRVGALAELVTDGVDGRLVPPDDAPALAAAMNEFMGDPARRAAAGRAARRRILADFTIERTVRETADLIASVV